MGKSEQLLLIDIMISMYQLFIRIRMKILLLSLLLISNCFASSKIDSLVSEDTLNRLNTIENLQKSLDISTKEIIEFEKSLLKAKKVAGREKVFVIIRNTMGVAAAGSFALSGTLLLNRGGGSEGSLYNILFGQAMAVVGAGATVVAIGSEVGVYFSKNEAKSLLIKTKELKLKIKNQETSLKTEIGILCKDDPRHQLCYY